MTASKSTAIDSAVTGSVHARTTSRAPGDDHPQHSDDNHHRQEPVDHAGIETFSGLGEERRRKFREEAQRSD